MTHNEVIKAWLARDKKRTHLVAGSMRFYDDTIYYTNIPVARIMKNGWILVSYDRTSGCSKDGFSGEYFNPSMEANQNHIAIMADGRSKRWEKPESPFPYVFRVKDVTKRPDNSELLHQQNRIRERLERILEYRGGWTWWNLFHDCKKWHGMAAHVAFHFNLDGSIIRRNRELFLKAYQHLKICSITKTRWNRILIDNRLRDDVPFPEVMRVIRVESNPLAVAMVAENLRVKYGTRGVSP